MQGQKYFSHVSLQCFATVKGKASFQEIRKKGEINNTSLQEVMWSEIVDFGLVPVAERARKSIDVYKRKVL